MHKPHILNQNPQNHKAHINYESQTTKRKSQQPEACSGNTENCTVTRVLCLQLNSIDPLAQNIQRLLRLRMHYLRQKTPLGSAAFWPFAGISSEVVDELERTTEKETVGLRVGESEQVVLKALSPSPNRGDAPYCVCASAKEPTITRPAE